MQSKIIIFCGKGGVGKTTLSLAMALRCAQAGKRVVVVSSHPLHELAVAVSLEGMERMFPVASRNMFVVHIDAKELLADLVHKNFPSRVIADAVLASAIYRNLVEVAPGLKEFQFLARLQQLAERAASGAPDYDLLLWDAPSSGHFLSTLHAARNFETFLSGPLASAGADLTRFFSNAAHLTLLPITTLEEMAVEETVEMCAKLQAEFGIKPAALLMNLVSPLLDAEAGEIEALRHSPDAAVRFAAERGLIERERSADLASRLPAPQTAIGRIPEWSSDLELLRETGESLANICVGLP